MVRANRAEATCHTMDDINTFGHVAYGIAYSPMLLQPSDGNPYTHDYNPGTLVSAREDDTGYGHQARDL